MEQIITIGREFGSGGRELGRRLAETLGCAYYDQEIVTEIANRTELSEQYVRSIVEQRPVLSFPIHVGRTLYPAVNPSVVQGQRLFQEQCRLLSELSEKRNCVIVGRCGDYILRDRQPFRIFVYAELASKIARCRGKGREGETMPAKELKSHLQEVDQGRAKYYGFYTGQKWGDRIHYDLCINTTNTEIKEVVSALAKLFSP